MNTPVHTEARDGVLIVTINRPEARNAINTATAEAIGAAMDRLDADPTLVCGVVTGAGGTFCAGMDLAAFLAGERPSIPVRGFAGIVEQPSAKPLVAAVEGAVVAGGFEIALACDLVVATERTRFGLPEVSRGLVAAGSRNGTTLAEAGKCGATAAGAAAESSDIEVTPWNCR
jgi:enoyl-CoA hydratase